MESVSGDASATAFSQSIPLRYNRGMSEEQLEKLDTEYPTTSCLLRALAFGLILLGVAVFAVILFYAWWYLEWYYGG